MKNSLEALPLLLRRRAALADLLPVIAFAASTGITIMVLGGLGAFIGRLPDSTNFESATYEESIVQFLVFCAAFATVLLVPSAVGLGGSAARLSLARREKDLASIRLVGGTTPQVASVAIVDVMVQCLIGSILGVVLQLACTPLLTRLDFGIQRFTFSELLPPWWAYPLLIVGLTMLAAVSAAIALSGVALSPLGVARDSRRVRMSVVRVLVWVAVIIGFIAVNQFASVILGLGEWAVNMYVVLLLVMIGLVVVGVNLVGPFFLWLIGLVLARLAPTPALMVGARRLANEPKAGWRAVASVTFAMIIAGFLTVISVLTVTDDPVDLMLTTAMSTGGLLTVVIAAVLAAVGTGVTQTARVIDQAPVIRAQHMAGAQVRQLQRARITEIMIPLLLGSVLAAGVVALVLLTVGTYPSVTNVTALLILLATFVGAYGLVLLSILIGAPLVRRFALAA